ncbi:glycosyltransferase [Butyrivibrio sp. XB500-5]|uniref:glycosyltransferase n=1 Tax=Butyrivibrio sp. XB500-5 TaxID=2364880 RepID=UPI000EA9FCCD|nr:glycosyltransferase [Butyrivibrio sp. XB500-5]RKM59548.1 glycosyltransferase [Butyrivibrio sp. XB500-5]
MGSAKKILWISYLVPYDGVPHAGGKIHNYYLKGIKKSGKFDIRLLTVAKEKELPKLDYDKYDISADVIVRKFNLKGILWRILWELKRRGLYDRSGGLQPPFIRHMIKEKAKSYSESGYEPDVVIMQWTEVVVSISDIKRYFPKAKIVVIEEDVAFLSFERKFKSATNVIKKAIAKKQYERLKKLELRCISEADLVILNNHKDYRLLKNNIDEDKGNIKVWTPYFENYADVEYIGDRNEIVFYGAMNRPENWKSAIWFIENVWPLLPASEYDLKFYVVGGHPDKQLLKYRSDRIVVTGFVDDVTDIMKHAKCLAAPLVLGAGVKIKILEGLSLGIPVLTNDIGVEGIDVKDGTDYFLCKEPEEYADTICKIMTGEIDIKAVSANAKKYISDNYNISGSLSDFIETLKEL